MSRIQRAILAVADDLDVDIHRDTGGPAPTGDIDGSDFSNMVVAEIRRMVVAPVNNHPGREGEALRGGRRPLS